MLSTEWSSARACCLEMYKTTGRLKAQCWTPTQSSFTCALACIVCLGVYGRCWYATINFNAFLERIDQWSLKQSLWYGIISNHCGRNLLGGCVHCNSVEIHCVWSHSLWLLWMMPWPRAGQLSGTWISLSVVYLMPHPWKGRIKEELDCFL